MVLGNRLLCAGYSSRPSQESEGACGSFHDGKHLHRDRLPDRDHVRFSFFSFLTSSFGIWKYGLQIDKEHLLWNTPLDLAKLFGVICYSLGVAVIGPTSYVPLSLAPSPLEHHEEAAAVHDGSDRLRRDRCSRVHVARCAGRDVLLDGSQWASQRAAHA